MSAETDVSIYIAKTDGTVFYAKQADKPRESSSTIKIPILYLSLRKMVESKLSPDDTLARLPHHASRGSGILNWTSANPIKLADLILTTLVYSDCLATNILLDFIGGQARLNGWLKEQGLITRLHIPYLYFDDNEAELPKVGTTTATEIANLFRLLIETDWPADICQLVEYGSSHVNESWLELSLAKKIKDLHHKTGSMINSGPNGDTVLNAAGYFTHGQQKLFFGLLSHGQIGEKQSDQSLKQFIATQFAEKIDI